MWLECSCRLATQEHITFTASLLNGEYCGIMPRANCVQQHHRDILTATNNLLKFVVPKFYNLFFWNKWRFVLINLVLVKYFSSFSHQISRTTNLNSPGEKRNTHRAMPLQLLPVLPKKKKNWWAFTKQHHAFVWANRCESGRFWNKSDAEKQHHKNLLSVCPLLSQKVVHPTQEQGVPPWVVCDTSVLPVFTQMHMCGSQKTLCSCQEWQFSPCVTILLMFREFKWLKGSFEIQNNIFKLPFFTKILLVVTE